MIKKLFLIILSVFFAASSNSQTTIYVSPTGTSSGTGTMSSPKTFTDAIGLTTLGPGYTIILMDGTYYFDNVQYLWQKIGTPASPIVIKAQNKHQAILKGNPAKLADYWAVFYLSGCKHVIVDGIVTMHDPGSQDLSPGIRVSDASEFITIKNCLSYGNGGSGITSEGCDHIIIEDNICHSNSTRNEINTSGISMYQQKALTSNSDFFGCIIRRNICYNNTCDIPFKYLNESSLTPTDGNGIIIDSFDNIGGVPYGKNVLVENNVCYNNGGSGIKAYKSSLVRIVNNTVYHNNTILSKYNPYFAEIYVFESLGIGTPKVYNQGVYNNVVVSSQNTIYEDKAMVVDYDLNKVYNNHLVGVGAKFNNYIYEVANFPTANTVRPLTEQNYPKFVNASSGDFNLNSDSPLIGADTQTFGPTIDILGVSRPQGTYTDIGAYEYVYPTNGLSITPALVTLIVGANSQLTSNETVTWASSDTTKATVSASGLVTGIASGTVTITATASDNRTATATVNVITPLTLSPSTASIVSGNTIQLTASETVTWTSSDATKATVSSSGLVSAIAVGSATITATTSDNRTATSSITITAPVLNNSCGLIANSSFENGLTSWTNTKAAASVGTAAQSRSGIKCAILNKASGLTYTGFINVNAANKLNFEVYARIESAPINPQIAIEYRNAAGTKLGGDAFTINTTNYSLYSISKTLPVGTTKVNILTSKGSTAGKIYMDDFCMTNSIAARNSAEDAAQEEDDLMANFKMYPNPASNNLNFSILDRNQNSMAIQVMDLMGKQILDKTIDLDLGQEFVTLNVENFLPGNYFVKVTQGSKQKTTKLIKE